MNPSALQKEYTRTTTQRNTLLVLVVIFGLALLWLAFVLSEKEEKIVLVPTHIDQSLSVSSDGVSKELLQRISRDVLYLFLNRTPADYEIISDSILAYTHPSAYGRIKKQLADYQENLKITKVSQAFYPKSYWTDPANGVVEAMGILEQYVEGTRVKKEEIYVRIEWQVDGFQTRLTDVARIGHSESKLGKGQS